MGIQTYKCHIYLQTSKNNNIYEHINSTYVYSDLGSRNDVQIRQKTHKIMFPSIKKHSVLCSNTYITQLKVGSLLTKTLISNTNTCQTDPIL